MSADEQAIRDLLSQWFAATQAGDIPTVLSLMTDDVVFMVAGQPPFGKAEFAAASQGMAGMQFDGTQEIVELQVLGDWAWMRCRLRVSITPPEGQPIVRSGFTLTVLRKSASGHWQIARDANLLALERSPA